MHDRGRLEAERPAPPARRRSGPPARRPSPGEGEPRLCGSGDSQRPVAGCPTLQPATEAVESAQVCPREPHR